MESHELHSNRKLVTISAVFTYKFELRWMFYWITFVWGVIYGGHAPQIFVRYFTTDSMFISSVKKKGEESACFKFVGIFEMSMILGTFFNAGLVYFIRGEYPASKSDVPENLWNLHFFMIFGLLGSVGVSIYAWFKIFDCCDEKIRKIHSTNRKKLLARAHFVSEAMLFLAFGFKSYINFDWLVILEYLTIFFFVLLYVDLFSGLQESYKAYKKPIK